MFELAKENNNNNINYGTFYTYQLKVKEFTYHCDTFGDRIDIILNNL